ncbi:DUF3375 domain-containing protein [Paludibacter sp. 221]|uniref:DUF3375 domain-containing protein n=1 Tax=Paludibacter sp. 221 TaxID=2302939 RepID=UPI0013D5E7F5|nr:DUF3375 domain-containing protein [Paludibacter sp. 221]NDV46329.1 DUF3375 domain-containing protein [Paludibacter sp. 221]
MDKIKLSDILKNSPSVELLKLRNREFILLFFVEVFAQESVVSSENIHYKLESYLEEKGIEVDDENESKFSDTYEDKAKKYIQKWADSGFLTNYQNESGEIFYELSSYSSKTLDWLSNLKKEEYIGTESKFKALFNQLKELVEFTSEDKEKRLQLLEDKKLELEQQIQRLKMGEDIKVFEEYEIVPRFKDLNKIAKELLSDFKEVDDNFKIIIKEIYQKQSDTSLNKGSILQYTFDALAQLKDSSQGKSFYAFWEFLLSSELQQEWDELTQTLYQMLDEKNIEISDVFLKDMKRHLFDSGQKVYKTNDKMAEKLSRIIRETEVSKTEVTKNLIQEIKKLLLETSKTKTKKNPDISLEIEEMEISLPFERKLTYEQSEEIVYKDKPLLAEANITDFDSLHKLFNPYVVDKKILRKHIKEVLNKKSQATIHEIIEDKGGLSKGLPELFGYVSLAREFKHTVNTNKTQSILFDEVNKKSIQIPEIILTK